MPDITNFTAGNAADIIEILLEAKSITHEQAEQARRRMRRAQQPAHQALMDLGFSSQADIYKALSQVSGLPFIILEEQTINENATQKVPAKVALMGCAVNGPGEAREADFGIAGGIGEALFFRHGQVVEKISEEQVIERLIEELRRCQTV